MMTGLWMCLPECDSVSLGFMCELISQFHKKKWQAKQYQLPPEFGGGGGGGAWTESIWLRAETGGGLL
jgi:hypothetical protein